MTKSRHDPAPHGYEEDGTTPKAPYGYNLDNTPRKSNRGARPGARGGRAKSPGESRPRATAASKQEQSRKETIVGLVEMAVITPLAGLSGVPGLQRRIGPAQADALAGDALLVAHHAPALADALIVLGQSKPAMMVWVDRIEENAPYLMLATVATNLTKAVVENHARPNPRLNAAGRTYMTVRAFQLAEEVEQMAAAMGIPTSAPADYRQEPPPPPEPQDAPVVDPFAGGGEDGYGQADAGS